MGSTPGSYLKWIEHNFVPGVSDNQKFSRCEKRRHIFKQMQGRDKNSPQGDCTHLHVSSASLLRQHALSVHLFCSIICICFVTPRCRCNHIWQVGSCTLCGIRRSGRRSWMDEPETKHAVFTLRDAFDIIYLAFCRPTPQTVVRNSDSRERQWQLWIYEKWAARFPSSCTQILTPHLKS